MRLPRMVVPLSDSRRLSTSRELSSARFDISLPDEKGLAIRPALDPELLARSTVSVTTFFGCVVVARPRCGRDVAQVLEVQSPTPSSGAPVEVGIDELPFRLFSRKHKLSFSSNNTQTKQKKKKKKKKRERKRACVA